MKRCLTVGMARIVLHGRPPTCSAAVKTRDTRSPRRSESNRSADPHPNESLEMDMKFTVSRVTLATLIGVVGACAGDPTGTFNPDEAYESVTIAIEVAPTGVACVQVTAAVAGQTVTQNLGVAAGASTLKLALGVLPAGKGTFSGKAFAAACSSVTSTTTADWVADAVSADVRTGVALTVPLVFRQMAGATVSADFRRTATAISAICQNTMAVLSDGSVRVWGYLAGSSQLTPAAFAPFASLGAVKQITGNCGTAYAVTTAGKLYSAPLSATGTATLVAGIANVDSVSVGALHVCAKTAAKEAYCWGGNGLGQVGDGSTATRTVPFRVWGSGVQQVKVGAYFSCALLDAGTVSCWGNLMGATITTPTAMANTAGAKQLAMGHYSALAVRADGQVLGWGPNDHGELGNGATSPVAQPTAISGLAGASYVALSGGDGGNFNIRFGCAVVAGSLRCWGNNSSGQLGTGNGIDAATPVVVPGLTDVVQVEAGVEHACALTRAGDVKCWGGNSRGTVGDGTTTYRFTPTPVRL